MLKRQYLLTRIKEFRDAADCILGYGFKPGDNLVFSGICGYVADYLDTENVSEVNGLVSAKIMLSAVQLFKASQPAPYFSNAFIDTPFVWTERREQFVHWMLEHFTLDQAGLVFIEALCEEGRIILPCIDSNISTTYKDIHYGTSS